jgi:hypothetical protein
MCCIQLFDDINIAYCNYGLMEGIKNGSFIESWHVKSFLTPHFCCVLVLIVFKVRCKVEQMIEYWQGPRFCNYFVFLTFIEYKRNIHRDDSLVK